MPQFIRTEGLSAGSAPIKITGSAGGLTLSTSATSSLINRGELTAVAIDAVDRSAPTPLSEDPGPGGDSIAGDASTTATLQLDRGVNGFINTAGDKDWYAIELTAGTFYQFSLKGVGTGANPDPLLELRDAAGNLVALDDDGGTGRDSLLQTNVEQSGTYYLSAGAYQNNTGEYRLSAKEIPTPDILDSIDWGTVVDSSDTIQVYFAQAGETYDGETSLGWNAYEIQQAMLAFEQYANIVNVNFVQTTDASAADFKLVTNEAEDYLGYFNPPGETNEGVGVFSRPGFGWDEGGEGGLDQGGYGFITLIHEFGHGMGLAHPHDNGGTSTVMLGVTGPFDSYGAFDLNQGVYTTMSYNDAWPVGPDGLSEEAGYGWQGTMMALDVAILQEKYGANTSYRTGNDTYLLATDNAPGTMYACIWDAGGNDWLAYTGASNAVLDLRAATIDYSPTGGGVISHVAGIIGGYTIAQGAVIENAGGGSGNDSLTGNDSANKLKGGGGADSLNGGMGSDRLSGGGGADVFLFTAVDTGKDTIVDLNDNDIINLKLIDANSTLAGDQKFKLVDGFDGHAGQAWLSYDDVKNKTVLQLDIDGDSKADMRVLMTGDHSDFIGFVL
jgi:serralysin